MTTKEYKIVYIDGKTSTIRAKQYKISNGFIHFFNTTLKEVDCMIYKRKDIVLKSINKDYIKEIIC